MGGDSPRPCAPGEAGGEQGCVQNLGRGRAARACWGPGRGAGDVCSFSEPVLGSTGEAGLNPALGPVPPKL